jgi:hypothetical protein
MGNLRGYAGPLPQSYIDDQAGERWPGSRSCRTALSGLSWAHIRGAPAEQAEAGHHELECICTLALKYRFLTEGGMSKGTCHTFLTGLSWRDKEFREA